MFSENDLYIIKKYLKTCNRENSIDKIVLEQYFDESNIFDIYGNIKNKYHGENVIDCMFCLNYGYDLMIANDLSEKITNLLKKMGDSGLIYTENITESAFESFEDNRCNLIFFFKVNIKKLIGVVSTNQNIDKKVIELLYGNFYLKFDSDTQRNGMACAFNGINVNTLLSKSKKAKKISVSNSYDDYYKGIGIKTDNKDQDSKRDSYIEKLFNAGVGTLYIILTYNIANPSVDNEDGLRISIPNKDFINLHKSNQIIQDRNKSMDAFITISNYLKLCKTFLKKCNANFKLEYKYNEKDKIFDIFLEKSQ